MAQPSTESLYAILGRLFAIDPRRIDSDTLLFEDLGADSLAMTELADLLSSTFQLDLSNLRPDLFRTVGDILCYVEEHVS